MQLFFLCSPSIISTWTSLVTQTVKCLPTMRETWVQCLGWEDLEKEMATHSTPGKSHGQRSLIGYSPWGCQELYITEQLCFPLFIISIELCIQGEFNKCNCYCVFITLFGSITIYSHALIILKTKLILNIDKKLW